MSESQDIKPRVEDDLVAPTPQNTPLNTHVPTSRPAQKPKVEDVAEGDEDEGEDVSSMNPASLLASVSMPVGKNLRRSSACASARRAPAPLPPPRSLADCCVTPTIFLPRHQI
jgi:hypothetical protein